MSAPMEPAALLREAARLLREHAAAVDVVELFVELGEPLAAWLDDAASQVEYLPPRRHSAQALVVARAIVKAAQHGPTPPG